MTDQSLEQRVTEALKPRCHTADWVADEYVVEMQDLIRDLWAERNEFAVELSRLARKNSDLITGQDELKAKLAAPLPEDVRTIIEMCIDAALDERLSDGGLYRKAADMLERQARRIAELEAKLAALDNCLEWRKMVDELRQQLYDATRSAGSQ